MARCDHATVNLFLDRTNDWLACRFAVVSNTEQIAEAVRLQPLCYYIDCCSLLTYDKHSLTMRQRISHNIDDRLRLTRTRRTVNNNTGTASR